MQNKKINWKKTLRWLPGVLISLIAIYAVFKFIKIDDLKTAFRTVKRSFVILLVVLSLVGVLLRGKVWQIILGKGVTYSQSFFGIGEGYFLNNVLPLRAGEIGRSILVGRNTGKGTFYVLSTIVIERALDIACAAVLLLSTLPFLVGMDWVKPVASIALVLVIAGFVALFLVARYKDKVLSWLHKITKPSKFVNFLLPKVENIIEGFSVLTNPAQIAWCLLWLVVNWAVWTSVYCFAVQAVIPGAPFWWGAFVGGVMSLGVAIPSAPSALGVYEASFVAAFAVLGAQSGTALAYALIMHLVSFLNAAIFGVWGLARDGMSFSKVLATVGSNDMTDSTKEEKESV